MKSMILSFIVASSCMGWASTQEECPQLTGHFRRPPSPYSTCVHGYDISQKVESNILTYHISKIICGGSDSGVNYEVDSKEVSNSAVVGQVTTRIFCHNQTLKVRESTAGITEETVYGLDEKGNLVITEGHGLGAFINHGNPNIYLKTR